MPDPRVPASSEPRPDCPKCGKSLTGPWHMRYCEPEPHESERIAEFAARGSSEPRPENPTPEEKVRDGSHLPGGYRTLYVPTSVALRAVADARDDERRRIRGLVANRAADLLVTDSPLGSALADLWKDLIDGSSE